MLITIKSNVSYLVSVSPKPPWEPAAEEAWPSCQILEGRLQGKEKERVLFNSTRLEGILLFLSQDNMDKILLVL